MARRRAVENELEIDVFEQGRWTARPLGELLRRLTALQLAPRRALSLYLDARWSDEQQRDRVWLSVRDRARTLRAEDPSLGPDLDEVLALTEARVKQHADVGWAGCALFRCAPAGLSIAVRARAPFPTLLVASPLVLVRPLVTVAHTHERAIVALAHAQGVRVYEVALGRLREAAELSGPVPPRTERGGWSQLKFQHHRAVHVDALHKAAAEAIARVFDQGGPARVLLGGTVEAVANLERELPKRVAEEAIRVERLSPADPAHQILAEVERALERAGADEERTRIHEIVTMARSGGRGALGVDAVVDAIDRGRVMEVFVAAQLDGALHACTGCGALAREPEVCALCGSPALPVDAGEAIVRAAVPLGARVHVVDDGPLAQLGAVASLRF